MATERGANWAAADGGARGVAPRSLEFAMFAIGLLWLLASRAGAASGAEGIAGLLRMERVQPLLNQVFLVILLATGYTALGWMATRNSSVRANNALPLRPTAAAEWQKGAALGWGLLLAAVLPAALVGDLHPRSWWTAEAWGTALLATATLGVGALATELAFRGFLFRRLINAVGESLATVVLALVYAIVVTSPMSNTRFSFGVAFVTGLLFSSAYLRTRGLWLGWGMRFGWTAVMGVLFGLPLAGSQEFASVVATGTTGHVWLTGGAYGPEGALWTGLVLLAGFAALFPLTREYAWEYAQPVIVAAGYPMDVVPPAAHAAMEAEAAQPKLVQIAGIAPATAPVDKTRPRE